MLVKVPKKGHPFCTFFVASKKVPKKDARLNRRRGLDGRIVSNLLRRI
jgi:hypothetical protein